MKLASVQSSALSASLAATAMLWSAESQALRPGGPYHLDDPIPSNLDTVHVTATRPPPPDYDPFSNPVNHRGGRSPYGRYGSLRSNTAKEQETDDRNEDCGENAGNPVVLYTGNKVEHELDFSSHGEMGLYLQRTYNHHWSAAGVFGHHWLSNLDYSLAFSAGDAVAWAQRPDGRRIKFKRDGASTTWLEDKPGPVAFLVRNADGGYTLFNEDRGTETYNADGYILQRRNEQGVAWNFEYQDQRLRSVTHSSGRRILLGWNGSLLAQVTDPDGAVYRYAYTADAFGKGRSRLASTTLPGAPETHVTYHYEDRRFPGGLTGKSFNGVRYSNFAYDQAGRAVLTEHAGGVERHTFEYEVLANEPVSAPPAPPAPGGSKGDTETGWCEYRPGHGQICFHPAAVPGDPVLAAALADGSPANAIAASRTRPVKMRTTMTNPLGRRTIYLYEDGRQRSVTGEASPRCPASYKERTYDANGHPDLFHDFANNLTDFDYDARGRLLKQVEAVASAAERTTLYRWDDNGRLLGQTTPGLSEVTYTYESKGNIASTSVRNLGAHGVHGQTRTTRYAYTYHANGLKASVRMDGPLEQDDITFTYNGRGDLVSVINGLGHQTEYLGHDQRGAPGTIRGPNAETTTRRYDARGRLTIEEVTAGTGTAATHISYSGTGDLAGMRRPDGAYVRYEYDAARRLINTSRPIDGGNHAWTRINHDAASNVVKTEVTLIGYGLDTQVVGQIDEVTHDAQWNWFAGGWACSTGSNASVGVSLHVDGKHLASGAANLSSDASVAAACQTTGVAHRFRLPISLNHRWLYGGKTISVVGKSPRGAGHDRALANHAAFTVPVAAVIGDVAGVSRDANWNYRVHGWACAVGHNQPTKVELHHGPRNGAATYLRTVTGTLTPNVDLKGRCQSNGAYLFNVPLDDGIRIAHGGKPIHIYAVAPPGLFEIARSGTLTVPHYVRSAEVVSFSASPDHMLNGETSRLTAQFRNTGNVLWSSETYLAWGEAALSQAASLNHAVAPGGIATFDMRVAPANRGPGVKRFAYLAQMAAHGTAFGSRASTNINVENQHGYCPPVGPCHHPISIEAPVGIDAAGGEN